MTSFLGVYCPEGLGYLAPLRPTVSVSVTSILLLSETKWPRHGVIEVWRCPTAFKFLYTKNSRLKIFVEWQI